MIDLIKSEGFWACFGAIIGACVGAITTYIVSKQTSKLEVKKQRIEYLNLRRVRLEEILRVTSKIFYPENVFDNTMNVFLLMRNNSHFISNNTIDTLLNSLQEKIDLYKKIVQHESSDKNKQHIHILCSQINDIISDINLTIENILKDITRILEKEIIK